jgi:predicted porin
MKYVLSAVALALAAPAFAQSSVTVYGIVDVNGVYAKGDASRVTIGSGGLQGSRIGFKGSEDLGDGVRADFVLEGGLNLDTGGSAQGGALFGRQAFGALRTPAGTFSAGRQYSSIYTITSDFSAFSNTNFGPTTAILGGFAGGYEPVQGGPAAQSEPASGSSINGGPARVNNSFRYTSPTYAGFSASALYGAGEVTGRTNQNRLWDGSLRYSGYGLDAMVSYVNDKADAVAGTAGSTPADVSTLTVAALYGWDAFHVEGGYMKVDDKRSNTGPTGSGFDGQGFWIGGDYRLGANLFKAQFVQNKADHIGSSTTNAYGIGYQYDFSKRTAFYTALTRFQNGSGAGKGGLGRYNQAVPTGLTTPTDNDITEFGLGFRHAF